jgi:hypothetical protein
MIGDDQSRGSRLEKSKALAGTADFLTTHATSMSSGAAWPPGNWKEEWRLLGDFGENLQSRSEQAAGVTRLQLRLGSGL